MDAGGFEPPTFSLQTRRATVAPSAQTFSQKSLIKKAVREASLLLSACQTNINPASKRREKSASEHRFLDAHEHVHTHGNEE